MMQSLNGKRHHLYNMIGTMSVRRFFLCFLIFSNQLRQFSFLLLQVSKFSLVYVANQFINPMLIIDLLNTLQGGFFFFCLFLFFLPQLWQFSFLPLHISKFSFCGFFTCLLNFILRFLYVLYVANQFVNPTLVTDLSQVRYVTRCEVFFVFLCLFPLNFGSFHFNPSCFRIFFCVFIRCHNSYVANRFVNPALYIHGGTNSSTQF